MTAQPRIVVEPSAQGIVDATSKPPFLMHGGWVLGNVGTHDRLVREPTP